MPIFRPLRPILAIGCAWSPTMSRMLSPASWKGGVTVAEWVLLREVHDHRSISPSRLADRLSLTRGAVSKLADRLIDKGLLGREPSPEDGRAHSLALTADGRTLVPELAGLADSNDAEFFGDLTPDDRATMERVLKSVVAGCGLKTPPLL